MKSAIIFSKNNMYLTDATDDDSSTTELQVKSLLAVSEMEVGHSK